MEEEQRKQQKREQREQANDDDEYEWVYYNAINCTPCEGQNGLVALNEIEDNETSTPCEENEANDKENDNAALGADYEQEWEYYDEMPASEEEYYYDPLL